MWKIYRRTRDILPKNVLYRLTTLYSQSNLQIYIEYMFQGCTTASIMFFTMYIYISQQSSIQGEFMISLIKLNLSLYFQRFAGVDLDKCLKRNGDPCQFFSLQYEFFCGNSMACRREDTGSVQRAMYNADRYFSVVGLTEDLDTTFR